MDDTAAADLTIADLLPDGFIALGFVGSINALDENGESCFYNVRNGVSSWEAIGMLTTLVDSLRDNLRPRSDV